MALLMTDCSRFGTMVAGMAVHAKPTPTGLVFDSADKDPSKQIVVQVLHVSCGSDARFDPSKKYAGLVLYACGPKGGKMSTEFVLGGRRCKAGYIVVRDSSGLQDKYRGEGGVVHGNLFRDVFGESLGSYDIFGAGFSIDNGVYKFNSFTFNTAAKDYQDGDKRMNEYEGKAVESAVKWYFKTGNQNYVLQHHFW